MYDVSQNKIKMKWKKKPRGLYECVTTNPPPSFSLQSKQNKELDINRKKYIYIYYFFCVGCAVLIFEQQAMILALAAGDTQLNEDRKSGGSVIFYIRNYFTFKKKRSRYKCVYRGGVCTVQVSNNSTQLMYVCTEIESFPHILYVV